MRVVSNTDGFGIGEYVGSPEPNFNAFTVVSGQITSALFLDFGIANTPPAVTCCSIRLELGGQNFTGLTNKSNALSESSRSGLTFTPVSGVPLPRRPPTFRHRPRRVGSARLAQEAEGSSSALIKTFDRVSEMIVARVFLPQSVSLADDRPLAIARPSTDLRLPVA